MIFIFQVVLSMLVGAAVQRSRDHANQQAVLGQVKVLNFMRQRLGSQGSELPVSIPILGIPLKMAGMVGMACLSQHLNLQLEELATSPCDVQLSQRMPSCEMNLLILTARVLEPSSSPGAKRNVPTHE